MFWLNEPGQWNVPFGSDPEVEGYGGGWDVLQEGSRLTLRPDSKKNLWRTTYFQPIVLKDDAPCYVREVPADMELTMEVYFRLRPQR